MNYNLIEDAKVKQKFCFLLIEFHTKRQRLWRTQRVYYNMPSHLSLFRCALVRFWEKISNSTLKIFRYKIFHPISISAPISMQWPSYLPVKTSASSPTAFAQGCCLRK